jgi:hypothetical protein
VLPSINIPSLSVLAGIVGSYFAVFQTHFSAGLKSAIGSAALALIGWVNREFHATERTKTTAAASLGQPPASTAGDVAAITRSALAAMGHPAAGSIPVPPGPSTL